MRLENQTARDIHAKKGAGKRRTALALAALMAGTILSGCTNAAYTSGRHIQPATGSPVNSNDTPYSACLTELSLRKSAHKPVFAIGQIADKTGQKSYDGHSDSTALTQGVSEMMISAFYKTKQVGLTERLDMGVGLAEQKLIEQRAIKSRTRPMSVQPADFMVLGALTELNYNIVSGGARLYVAGVGAGVRSAVINVGLDVRVVDVRTFKTIYVTSLQKQIVGHEVEGGVYRFFDHNLVEFDAGAVKNEPLQLGVRSVAELATYQILTEGLGFPAVKARHCQPGMDTLSTAQTKEKSNDA
ncbi:CsgG/HfaB family protein [Mariluticola halotolerans]|uniref:CsgG/HfaB family protein n=1 Tax=Mariluticola halotolerans TaxID=2909283 RepID=UPI0026E24334|nr:CsgG/HfaB family protein [Mariluticola halotolerans]UJQ93411.1 hypothetical protein L1P08_10440 [Mariluticola halotolerans]